MADHTTILLFGLAIIGAGACAWALKVAVVSLLTAPYVPTEVDG